MNTRIFFALTMVAVLLPTDLPSQPAATTIVTPVQTVSPAAPPIVATPDNGASAQITLKLLQEMKAANELTLKAQEAQLVTLDELQKAAEEIKIYSKRG